MIPVSLPVSCFVAWFPSVATTFGLISSICLKSHGSHFCFSSGSGSRLPGGRHFSVFAT